ncbi:MAG: class IIb bacteriocin, lactobin A/cerein 7B family [Bacillaceae bacterium]|uniref:Class IIb bacteriocin, lactobin A/cerein 7B family n=1 Tax=Alkalihalobacterium chitinilyticum TaxID=2980103 RepID=A0ABT5VEW3_9BACI|nr:class IIb bacteriocin, lactobin A/cerein 7B family [Alkalihalobacterium chitinilyticum]MDE5414005.1 class IIb bacteriocin, lactobin A/cerein 7B family [Alkalihalobacterium chitinilyticum]MEB1809768.1 class IIb bacteriocin, lactobin A/cerein 7B family [Bacillaceae bacterium]
MKSLVLMDNEELMDVNGGIWPYLIVAGVGVGAGYLYESAKNNHKNKKSTPTSPTAPNWNLSGGVRV